MSSNNTDINPIKRQYSVDISADHEETKKLRRPAFNDIISITCIEHLSNEVLYEIFDYLDGCDTSQAFINLNIRFNHLIIYSSSPIKIYRSVLSKQILEDDYEQLIISNKHRIISFHMYSIFQVSSFLTLHYIDSSFNRLESLDLCGIQYKNAVSLLLHLITLPRLCSLKLSLGEELKNLSLLYRLIFRLPSLKYNKLSSYRNMSLILLPYDTEECSSVEHLIIDHACSCQGLLTILSCTPRLRRLRCKNLIPDLFITRDIPENMSTLTYVSLDVCNLSFDEFEIMIKKLFSQLRSLHSLTSLDSSYLDAARWERLILRHMPHLRIFDLTYTEQFHNQFTFHQYHSLLDRFSSPFWIERRWFLEFKICINSFSPSAITYAIRPTKKQSYEWHDYMIDDTNSNTSSTRLHIIVEDFSTFEYQEPILEYMRSIFSLVQITCLHIDFQLFSVCMLIHLLLQLTNLDSLIVISQFPEHVKILTDEQTNAIRLICIDNKITKVNLERMTELDQVHDLMNLCPRMRKLQVKCRNMTDIEWLVRYVLMKKNTNLIPHLCSLCLWFSAATDIIVTTLETIINTEKLLVNYTIKRICDKIYLRWNEHL